MNDFATWKIILSYAGATTITALLTEIAKAMFNISGKQVLGVAIGIAEILVIAATLFTIGHDPSTIALAVVNAVFVGWAASGLHDTLATKK